MVLFFANKMDFLFLCIMKFRVIFFCEIDEMGKMSCQQEKSLRLVS